MRYVTRSLKFKAYDVTATNIFDLSTQVIRVYVGPGENKKRLIQRALKAADCAYVKEEFAGETIRVYRMPESDFIDSAEVVKEL